MGIKLKIEKDAKLEYIPTEKIQNNPDNPRLIFRLQELENLLLSISQIGIQVPITVYKDGNYYILIDGERRWKCAQKLNMSTIPALIQEKPTRLQNLLFMFNIHALREQWDIFTIAMKLPVIINLLEDEGIKPTERELASYTGLSQGTIRRSKLLMKLPQEYKDLILKELEKPKSKQKLTEDFFIEMEKGLSTVKRYLPNIIDDINKTRDILIKKYRTDIITNIVDFRNVSRIARSEKLGVPGNKVQKALTKLFNENDYSIENAFRDSAEWAYNEQDLLKRLEGIIHNLRSLTHDIPDSEQIDKILIELRKEIDRYLEENR